MDTIKGPWNSQTYCESWSYSVCSRESCSRRFSKGYHKKNIRKHSWNWPDRSSPVQRNWRLHSSQKPSEKRACSKELLHWRPRWSHYHIRGTAGKWTCMQGTVQRRWHAYLRITKLHRFAQCIQVLQCKYCRSWTRRWRNQYRKTWSCR